MGNFHSASEQGRQATASMPEPRLSNKAQLIKQGVWVKSVNEYQVTKQLGKGSFGEVYLATAKGQKVAIKMLKKSALKRQRQGKFGSALDTVKAEIALMKKIRHPNCVGMHEVIDDPSADEVFIVLEFVDGGSSQALGRDGTPIPLKEAAIWSHMRHLVLGLEYLHMNGIVHRDIKPDNLLVSKRDGVLKIADFGTAIFAEASADSQKTAGTPAFFAPEMCDTAQSGKFDGRMCDMWALGVTLHLWVYASAPFNEATPMLIMEKIARCPPVVEQPKDSKAKVSDGLKALISAMLTKASDQRMTLNQLRLNAWLTKNDKQPLAAQPNVRVQVTDQDIQDAITPLMQVAGHEGTLRRAGQTTLVKKTSQEEYEFYKAFSASDVSSYAPILYGLQDADSDANARAQALTGRSETRSEHDIDLEHSVSVLVQDLTAGMSSPCVMDIKMGTRTVLEAELSDKTPRPDLLKKMDAIDKNEAKAEERAAGGVTKVRYLRYRDTLTSTSTLGFRIDAAMISKDKGKKRQPIDVNFRALKDEAQVVKTMETFFQASPVLLKAVLIKLEHMRSALERSTFFHKHAFVRSSILIVYDHDAHAKLIKQGGSAEDLISITSPAALEVKMIDFAHSHRVADSRKLTHRAAWKQGTDEDGYLTGVDSLVKIIKKILGNA